jgi:phosphoglycolate phosphatase
LSDVLVLWDIDHTLVDAAGVGREAHVLAFRRLYGLDPVSGVDMAGRTDRAIAVDIFRASGMFPDGVVDEAHLEAFRIASEEAFDELAPRLAVEGRALPGALDALLALATRPVVQSVLTGNIRRLAEVKLEAFDLLRHLDAEIGGYGWHHAVRAQLVGVARTAATGRHGRPYEGTSTVLVGDTPRDVEAALATGARVVAVATGRYTADQLTASGAHVVLPDLSDTDAVITAVLGT